MGVRLRADRAARPENGAPHLPAISDDTGSGAVSRQPERESAPAFQHGRIFGRKTGFHPRFREGMLVLKVLRWRLPRAGLFDGMLTRSAASRDPKITRSKVSRSINEP